MKEEGCYVIGSGKISGFHCWGKFIGLSLLANNLSQRYGSQFFSVIFKNKQKEYSCLTYLADESMDWAEKAEAMRKRKK